MLETLPEWIDSKRLAVKGHHLIGQVAISKLSQRLCDTLYDTDGYVQVDWKFLLDDKKRPTIFGNIKTQFQMLCHRCLTPVVIEVDTKIALVVFNKEPSLYEELPPDYDAITLPNKPVSLLTLIENELILALPIVAKHEICPSNQFQLPDEAIEQDDNPFHLLAKIIKND